MPKNFSWSWSRLKNFRTCPKRHYHVDIEKSFQEAESDALKWGNELHKAMAERVAHGVVLPPTMARFEDWAQRIGTFGSASIKVENKLAMDDQFRPTSFFDNSTWFRCVVDVLMILPPARRAAITIDWKTGKVHPEYDQLALSAQVVFAHYPEVDKVLALYAWLGNDDQTKIIYRRDEMVPLWNKMWPEINVMKEAFRTTTYPPRPSGICISYCPVSSCPHHGRGSH